MCFYKQKPEKDLGNIGGQFSCMLVGGCRVWFLIRRPYCTLDRQRFGLRMIVMLHSLSASSVIPLQLHASLPWTYNWLFSLMSASCFGLRPPAAMTDGWFQPVQAVSSASLCNAFLEHHDHAFLLGACWGRLLWSRAVFHSQDMASPAQLHLKLDGLFAGQAGSLEDFFEMQYCHLMPRMECRQHC